MKTRNTQFEKRSKYQKEVIFPLLRGKGEGIGNYITYLEIRNETLLYFMEEQKKIIQQLQDQLK